MSRCLSAKQDPVTRCRPTSSKAISSMARTISVPSPCPVHAGVEEVADRRLGTPPGLALSRWLTHRVTDVEGAGADDSITHQGDEPMVVWVVRGRAPGSAIGLRVHARAQEPPADLRRISPPENLSDVALVGLAEQQASRASRPRRCRDRGANHTSAARPPRRNTGATAYTGQREPTTPALVSRSTIRKSPPVP
jgi:hypothetical protein